jgi:hypothetical protein
MKQRLRFLRRRHTDSSLESSVRPSKDELEKWAKSFLDLMSSRCKLSTLPFSKKCISNLSGKAFSLR